MNFARNIVVGLLVIGFAVSFASARENLNVIVVFDIDTTHYSNNRMWSLSRNLVRNLNKTFKNSGLSDVLTFNLTSIHKAYVTAKNDERLEEISDRFYSSRYKFPLSWFQSNKKADIVVTIMTPPKNDEYCGQAINIPYNNFGFSDPDNSYIFLSTWCIDQPRLIGHEVGHIFGIHHGQYGGDFVRGIANGYGVDLDWSLDYGTIMSKAIISSNRFSNPNVNKCGVFNKTNACGNSRSNAYKFIRNNAKYYNRRGR